jgi:hypothetical protein
VETRCVLHGRADDRILDSYEAERIAFARRLVATTDQAFTGVTSSSATARLLRQRVAPVVVPVLLWSRAFRRIAFRTISQTGINYRASALSDGHVGDVHGGDRLPWIRLDRDGHGADNFAPLTSLDWQVHVYGAAAPEVRAVCGERHLPLHEFRWESAMRRAGFRRNALYLVRPDGYVGLAAAEQSRAALRRSRLISTRAVFAEFV